MLKIKKNLIVFFIILIVQLFYFSDYLIPFSWGKLKVEGLACTCPDLTVKTGRIYLKSITPDSLKKFDINYNEIYLSENSIEFPKDTDSTSIFDPSIIKGKVVGKRKINGDKQWNLVFKVTDWKTLNILLDPIIKFSFLIQLIIFIYINKKQKKNRIT